MPPVPADLAGRNFLVFIGTLNYFPNADGVCWFADTVFPALRRQEPDLELFLVGREPTQEVVRLGERAGITVTGAVDDVRPYVAAARAAITPLRLARGVQNKVLEALAMGKRALVSQAVCDTFQPELPPGVIRCEFGGGIRTRRRRVAGIAGNRLGDRRRGAAALFVVGLCSPHVGGVGPDRAKRAASGAGGLNPQEADVRKAGRKHDTGHAKTT